MDADGSAGVHRYVLAVGQERDRLCCAGIYFLPVIPIALFPAFVCFSFSTEREEPDADSDYGMGIVFNVLNGMMQAGGLFYFAPEGLYADGWAYWLRPNALPGALLFFAGMFINLHSDYVVRHLRKPGDTKHYLPAKGLYRYVTSANYFGELVEWTGFAILTASPAAWVFVWWTFANLVPRADAIYRYYREEFGDEAVGKRKRIIPCIY